MEAADAVDTDHIRSGSLDISAHAVQEVGHVNDVRLLGRILDDRLSDCAGSRHHNVDRRADRNYVHENMSTSHMITLGENSSVLY